MPSLPEAEANHVRKCPHCRMNIQPADSSGNPIMPGTASLPGLIFGVQWFK